MKLKLFLLSAVIAAGSLSAGAVVVDGINYSTKQSNGVYTATVSKPSSGQYEGDIIIPETIEYGGREYTVVGIDSKAFGNDDDIEYTGLTSVLLPETVTSIGGYAFKNCVNLESVNITANITSYTMEAFMNCRSLSSPIEIGTLTSFPANMFVGCESLTDITFADSQSSVFAMAAWFSGCTSLKSVVLPDYAQYIGAYMFGARTLSGEEYSACTALENVTLGTKTVSLSGSVFQGCTSLQWIKILNENNVVSANASDFTDVELSSITVYVPDELVEDYRAHAVWGECEIKPLSEFTEEAEPEPTPEPEGINVTFNVTGNVEFLDVVNMTEEETLSFEGQTYEGFVNYDTEFRISGREGYTVASVTCDENLTGYTITECTQGEDAYWQVLIAMPADDLTFEITIDTPTGIDTIREADGSSVIYNLQGMPVSGTDLPAGLYISNGRKFVVRK